MKRKKLFIITLSALIILIAINYISSYLLSINNLMCRNSVACAFITVFLLLALALLIQLQYMLVRVCKNISFKMIWRVLSGIILTLSVGLALAASGFMLFAAAFAYEPEHVVEKDGKKMVAYVDSFLQVTVEYHDYKNAFVCGKQVRIWEDYGNGGYDPFARDEMPEVKRYTYYDENGNVIKSNN